MRMGKTTTDGKNTAEIHKMCFEFGHINTRTYIVLEETKIDEVCIKAERRAERFEDVNITRSDKIILTELDGKKEERSSTREVEYLKRKRRVFEEWARQQRTEIRRG